MVFHPEHVVVSANHVGRADQDGGPDVRIVFGVSGVRGYLFGIPRGYLRDGQPKPPRVGPDLCGSPPQPTGYLGPREHFLNLREQLRWGAQLEVVRSVIEGVVQDLRLVAPALSTAETQTLASTTTFKAYRSAAPSTEEAARERVDSSSSSTNCSTSPSDRSEKASLPAVWIRREPASPPPGAGKFSSAPARMPPRLDARRPPSAHAPRPGLLVPGTCAASRAGCGCSVA